MFRIVTRSTQSRARVSRLQTGHGNIAGPFFMPIATRGAVKSLTVDDLSTLGAEIVLSNTYHLWLRPGHKLLDKFGGLHKFMLWSGPILTDSGGFQVFSLAKHRTITEKGVSFRDTRTGDAHFLSPELSIQIQRAIGSDIVMVLDECPPYPSSHEYVTKSLSLTTRWAQRCKQEHQKAKTPTQLLFGITQGSIYKDLRQRSAREIVKVGFDGYAIGGVAVGEPRKHIREVLSWTIPELPENKPRYLMGLGRPEEIVMAVRGGIDMFDCVIPTREARHGRLYLPKGKLLTRLGKVGYHTINIENASFRASKKTLTIDGQTYSLAYLHHLFRTKEPLAIRLATIVNLGFYLNLMAKIRQSIAKGDL